MKDKLISDNVNYEPNNNKSAKLNTARLNRFLCVLMFTITNFLFKYISNTYKEKGNFLTISSVLRFGFMCLICKYYASYTNKPLGSVLDFKNKKLFVLLRCLFVNCGMIFYVISLNYLKVGIAICINMLNPIFQIFFSFLILKESFNKKYIYLCLLSLLGVYFLILNKQSTPTDNSLQKVLVGIFFSLLSACSNSLIYVITKLLQDSYETNDLNYITSFWIAAIQFVISVIFSSDLIFLYADLTFGFMHLIIGIGSFLAFYFMGVAVKNADISKTSFITYAQLPMISLLSYIFYNEEFTLNEFIGIGIIISSLVIANTLK